MRRVIGRYLDMNYPGSDYRRRDLVFDDFYYWHLKEIENRLLGVRTVHVESDEVTRAKAEALRDARRELTASIILHGRFRDNTDLDHRNRLNRAILRVTMERPLKFQRLRRFFQFSNQWNEAHQRPPLVAPRLFLPPLMVPQPPEPPSALQRASWQVKSAIHACLDKVAGELRILAEKYDGIVAIISLSLFMVLAYHTLTTMNAVVILFFKAILKLVFFLLNIVKVCWNKMFE